MKYVLQERAMLSRDQKLSDINSQIYPLLERLKNLRKPHKLSKIIKTIMRYNQADIVNLRKMKSSINIRFRIMRLSNLNRGFKSELEKIREMRISEFNKLTLECSELTLQSYLIKKI